MLNPKNDAILALTNCDASGHRGFFSSNGLIISAAITASKSPFVNFLILRFCVFLRFFGPFFFFRTHRGGTKLSFELRHHPCLLLEFWGQPDGAQTAKYGFFSQISSSCCHHTVSFQPTLWAGNRLNGRKTHQNCSQLSQNGRQMPFLGQLLNCGIRKCWRCIRTFLRCMRKFRRCMRKCWRLFGPLRMDRKCCKIVVFQSCLTSFWVVLGPPHPHHTHIWDGKFWYYRKKLKVTPTGQRQLCTAQKRPVIAGKRFSAHLSEHPHPAAQISRKNPDFFLKKIGKTDFRAVWAHFWFFFWMNISKKISRFNFCRSQLNMYQAWSGSCTFVQRSPQTVFTPNSNYMPS